MQSRFKTLYQATRAAIFEGKGWTQPQLRQALGRGEPPEDLQALVEKVRSRPWTVTDDDWDGPRAVYSSEELFEIVVASAYGAAELRLEAAMAALEKA